MRRNWLGARVSFACAPPAQAVSTAGAPRMASVSPAPLIRSRRLTPGSVAAWTMRVSWVGCFMVDLPRSGGERGGGALDGGADAAVGAAAADVAAHRGVDLRLGGTRVLLQQRGGAHDLAGLAVAALRHVPGDPGVLHRLAGGAGGHRLDGGDLPPRRRGDGQDAAAGGHAV